MPPAIRNNPGLEEEWNGIIAKTDIIDNSEDSVELMNRHANPEKLQDRMKAFDSPAPVDARGILEMTAVVLDLGVATRNMAREGRACLAARKKAVCDDDNAGHMAVFEDACKQAAADVADGRDKVGYVEDDRNFLKIVVARSGTHADNMKEEDQRKVLKDMSKEDQMKVFEEKRDECIAARHKAAAHHCDALVEQTDFWESFYRLRDDTKLPGKLAAHHDGAMQYKQNMSIAYTSIKDNYEEVLQKDEACDEALASAEGRAKRSEEVAQEKLKEYLKAQAMHADDRIEVKLLRKAKQGLAAEVAKVIEELTKAAKDKEKGHELCDAVMEDALSYETEAHALYNEAMQAAAESMAGSVAAMALSAKLSANIGQLAMKDKMSELRHLESEKLQQEAKVATLESEKASGQPTKNRGELVFELGSERNKLQAFRNKIEECAIEIKKMENRIGAAKEALKGLEDFQKHGPALDEHELDAKAAKIAQDSWGEFELFVIPSQPPEAPGGGTSGAGASGVLFKPASAAAEPGTTVDPDAAATTAIQLQAMVPQIARLLEQYKADNEQYKTQNDCLRFEKESALRLRESLEQHVEEHLRPQNESLFRENESLKQQLENLTRQLSLGEACQRAICDAIERPDTDSEVEAGYVKLGKLGLSDESS